VPEENSGETEIAGAYLLPQSFAVTQGCLGKQLRIEIGRRRGTATLPALVWEDGRPALAFPPMDPALESALRQRLTSPSALRGVAGRVTSWNPTKRTASECHVGAISVRFSVPVEDVALPADAHGRTSYRGVIPTDIRDGMAPWFYRLRMWIEAAVDQDTDPDIPLVRSSTGRLSLFRMDQDTLGELGSWQGVHLVRDHFQPVNLQRLRRAVAQANASALPDDAHLLMGDARAALRRQRTRLAVIDAGTAVEMTLAAHNQAGPNLQPSGGHAPTLGWYVSQLQVTAQLPPDTRTGLVRVRNDAAHRNRQPTRPEALRALDIAKEIVERLDPLPV
jgi:hypothetical protein